MRLFSRPGRAWPEQGFEAAWRRSKTQFGYRRHPDQDRAGADAGRTSGRGGRRRAGRAVACDRSGAARPVRRAARRRRPDRRGLARDLLLQALAGILGPARRRRAHGRQGRGLERRQDLSRRLAALSIQPAAGAGPQAAGLHQPAAILCRSLSGRSRAGVARHRPALAQQGDRAGAAQRPCGADDRDAGRARIGCARVSSSPATARARRCGRWSARNSPGRCSRTSS